MNGLDFVLVSAAGVAVGHTAVGVDHYVPFVALARAKGWTLPRTLGVGLVCGVGHVLSSVVLGVVGISLGLALERIMAFEGGRGSLSGWLLIVFGLVSAIVARRRGHRHPPATDRTTFWTLFLIFAFGPCEALIPLMMAPAVAHDLAATVLVVALFGALTIATMCVCIALGHVGLARLRGLDEHAEVLAGISVAASGVAVTLLGI